MSSPATAQTLFPSRPARPRILFVIPGDGQGSSMIFARRQAESVTKEGVKAHVFYLASRTSPATVFTEFGRFRKTIARIEPTAIHAHFGTVTALFSAMGAGSLPLVITYRGSDLNPAPSRYGWKAKMRAALGRLFSQLAALRAQKIICVSSQLRGRLWWKRSVVTILPSGVDPDVFRPACQTLARARLGWSDQERVVLFNAGHDALVKRLDLAQAAVERARQIVPALRLETLDGSVSPSLLPEIMNAADCLLVTSVFEGSPTVVQEALASNLPIVSVEVGDIAERLRGVRNCLIAPAEAAQLGQALASVVEPRRRSDGRLRVPEFSSARIARQLSRIYRELAGNE